MTQTLAQRRSSSSMWAKLGRDYALILPGVFISTFAFIVLVTLFTVSGSTAVIWIGVPLLALTLVVARQFADLSRARLRHWGAEMSALHYKSIGQGLVGKLRPISDARRWLDLVFETIVAFPIRVFTFTVAVSWTATALGGVTYWFWGRFLPSDSNDVAVVWALDQLSGGVISQDFSRSFGAAALVYFIVGVVFVVSLPAVMRSLALLEVAAGKAALNAANGEDGTGTRPEAWPDTGPDESSSASRDARTTDDATPFRGLAPNRSWSWIVAIFAAVTLLAINWPLLAAMYGVHVAIAMAIAIAHSAAIVLAVRWPLLGGAIGIAASTATFFATANSVALPWPWPIGTMVTQFAVILFVALRSHWVSGAGTVLVSGGIGLLTMLLARDGYSAGAMSSTIIFVSIGLAVQHIGVAALLFTGSRRELQRERAARKALDAKQRELEERNRIARELHDVVAHSMSIISVQATSAPYRHEDMSPEVAAEFATVADSSRRALSEMRGLLAILRGSEDALLAPQPTLADIESLVETTRLSGATVELATEPSDLREVTLPALTGLTSYRIVQEALSNAVRHAPGALIDVRVDAAGASIEIGIVNTAPAPQADAMQPAPGAGLGLAGVRERAEALGGSVDAGPTEDGGFAVHARIPLR